MKQIKNVEKLKKLIEPNTKYTSNYILSLIDSLSVEMPEPKPGALDALFEIVGYAQDRMNDELKKQFEDISGSARAELVQLQAEVIVLKERMSRVFCAYCDHEIKLSNHESIDLHEKIKTCDELHEHMKTCPGHPLFKLQSELKNTKGALRTLAKMHYACCPDCIMSEVNDHGAHIGCGDSVNCESKLIAYALANPTEEGEG